MEGKQSAMTQERIDTLNDMGFEWSLCPKQDWTFTFKELEQYKLKHGHCRIPQKFAENLKLGKWVNSQRTEYKKFMEGKQS
eukprot:CAMPEP_0195510766 /NCGR_PEP_ID=MMETSP0794_2-20130614/3321_1 /TAXON_ID=515487 /ORGANISM="Stephanopyxis turris, Strain CCMP 815" /LENGTH=80 /DNA_ID=CAMNT_0040638253 /DNA_START=1 /DNA_END=240 /DNA_ORIENTATION=-